jgi:hypothetical protein
MGGPWRDRRFDAAAWQRPAARSEGRSETVTTGGAQEYLTGIVIGYIASVITSIAIMLTLLKGGW